MPGFTAAKNQSVVNPGQGFMGGVMADLGFGGQPGAADEDEDEKKKREKALQNVQAGAQDALGAQSQFGGAAMDLGLR